jgi:hypothetical protein
VSCSSRRMSTPVTPPRHMCRFTTPCCWRLSWAFSASGPAIAPRSSTGVSGIRSWAGASPPGRAGQQPGPARGFKRCSCSRASLATRFCEHVKGCRAGADVGGSYPIQSVVICSCSFEACRKQCPAHLLQDAGTMRRSQQPCHKCST